MMQLEVSHRQAKLEHDAAKEKSVVEGEKQAKELAAEKERVQMANIELERELASGDDEIKTLTKKLNELEMFTCIHAISTFETWQQMPNTENF